MAQSGSAPALGAGGRRFKSCLPDDKEIIKLNSWRASTSSNTIKVGK